MKKNIPIAVLSIEDVKHSHSQILEGIVMQIHFNMSMDNNKKKI